MATYRVTITPNAGAGNFDMVVFNQYTGQLFAANSTDGGGGNPPAYLLQDGDTVETDDSYYNGGGNAPLDSAGNVIVVPPPQSISIEAEDAGIIYPDVMCYNTTPDNTNPGTDDTSLNNYPDQPDTASDPGYVDVDLSYFDSFEQYYDEDDNPVYTGDACDSSIGIRG